MKNDYLDRSSYVKGLLLLIGKDKKITDEERDFLHRVGTTLSFNKKFIEQAINELFENKYLGNEPPVFSQKQYAAAFLRDAITLVFIDNELSKEEFDWLRDIDPEHGEMKIEPMYGTDGQILQYGYFCQVKECDGYGGPAPKPPHIRKPKNTGAADQLNLFHQEEKIKQ